MAMPIAISIPGCALWRCRATSASRSRAAPRRGSRGSHRMRCGRVSLELRKRPDRRRDAGREPHAVGQPARRPPTCARPLHRRVDVPRTRLRRASPLERSERRERSERLRSNDWLLKPLSSGGGHGIRPWRRTTVPKGCYLQQRIDGRPGSVVFVAADGRAVPLGVSRQLIGDQRFGAGGVRYCGSILAPCD